MNDSSTNGLRPLRGKKRQCHCSAGPTSLSSSKTSTAASRRELRTPLLLPGDLQFTSHIRPPAPPFVICRNEHSVVFPQALSGLVSGRPAGEPPGTRSLREPGGSPPVGAPSPPLCRSPGGPGQPPASHLPLWELPAPVPREPVPRDSVPQGPARPVWTRLQAPLRCCLQLVGAVPHTGRGPRGRPWGPLLWAPVPLMSVPQPERGLPSEADFAAADLAVVGSS